MNGIHGRQMCGDAQNANRIIGIGEEITCSNCRKLFRRARVNEYKNPCCSKRCAMLFAKNKYRPKQDIVVRRDGRKMVRMPEHARSNRNGQIPYAYLVAEQLLGRTIDDNEVVHHIDLNPSNDSPENLLCMTMSEHVKLHNSLRERDEYGRFKKM